MPDELQEHTNPLGAALIEAALWRELATEAQHKVDQWVEKYLAQQLELDDLRAQLHDCNEYALRLQYDLERCRDS
jgi:hypothetical protein